MSYFTNIFDDKALLKLDEILKTTNVMALNNTDIISLECKVCNQRVFITSVDSHSNKCSISTLRNENLIF